MTKTFLFSFLNRCLFYEIPAVLQKWRVSSNNNNKNNNIGLYYYLNLNINNSKYMSGSSAYNKVTEVNPQLASALYQYVFEYYLPLSLEYVE